MSKFNILNATDGYKVYHMQQIPSTVKSVYGNLTARGDKYFTRVFKKMMDSNLMRIHFNNVDIPFGKINNSYLAFGMHQSIKEIVDAYNENFFNVPFSKAMEKYREDIKNYIGYEDILEENLQKLHSKGYLPITVKAVREGDFVEMNSPCMTVETEDGFGWLFGYLETVITNMIWKTITNATTALEFYKIATYFGKKTGSDEATTLFGFHDFSSRGMAGMEDSARNGVPHLLFFNGTESVGAIGYVREQYKYDYEKEGMLAGSIKATEHSISTTNIFEIQNENGGNLLESEEEFFKRYITEIYPHGLVGYVADTFDFYGFVYDILPKYKDDIEARDGKVVIRPDSFSDQIVGILGDLSHPFFLSQNDFEMVMADDQDFREDVMYGGLVVQILDKLYEYEIEEYRIVEVESTPEEIGTLPKLLAEFGFTLNDKGYAVLNPKIGIIYGDGFSLEKTYSLFESMEKMRICTSNIVIGIGAFQYGGGISRDTLGQAYKATSFQTWDDQQIDIYKDPKGVNKKSAKGRFTAKSLGDGRWEMKDQQTFEDSNNHNDMVVLLDKGKMKELEPFSVIRKRVREQVDKFM